MTKIITFPRLIMSTTVAVALLGAAIAETPVSDMPVRCVIDLEEHGHVTRIAAVVESEITTSGHYAMTVQSTTRGGTSSISQGGPFDIRANRLVTLSESTLSGTPDQFDVTLEIDWNGNTYHCQRSDEL